MAVTVYRYDGVSKNVFYRWHCFKILAEELVFNVDVVFGVMNGANVCVLNRVLSKKRLVSVFDIT